MSEGPAFHDLIRRVRAGDETAAAELVRHYEPLICRAVHFRLTDPGLRTLFESMDICQSVLASFFVRTAAGEYELETPAQLVNLLLTMARNKLAGRARREHAARRDCRRLAGDGGQTAALASREPGPVQQAITRETLHEVYRRLTPEERRLIELRNQGSDWNTIAAALGDSAEGLRKKLSRALDRVTQELGLDDTHDD
jgi:RNA polymerase sigma factor (sigma-70 family)